MELLAGETSPLTPEGNLNWTWVSSRCEYILGGVDGKKLSQKTWNPDDPQTREILGMTFGGTLQLKRIGQTEPTPDTEYQLVLTGRDLTHRFTFKPYIAEPVLGYEGNYIVAMQQTAEEAQRSIFIDYLKTYMDEIHG